MAQRGAWGRISEDDDEELTTALMMGTSEEATSSKLVVKQRFKRVFSTAKAPERWLFPPVLVITSCLSLWRMALYSKNLLPPLGQGPALWF